MKDELEKVFDDLKLLLIKKEYEKVSVYLDELLKLEQKHLYKMALIITKSFKDNDYIKESRQRLLEKHYENREII